MGRAGGRREQERRGASEAGRALGWHVSTAMTPAAAAHNSHPLPLPRRLPRLAPTCSA